MSPRRRRERRGLRLVTGDNVLWTMIVESIPLPDLYCATESSSHSDYIITRLAHAKRLVRDMHGGNLRHGERLRKWVYLSVE